jgi:trimeric intracellular cation channel
LQLSALLLGITDPFVPFENLFCAVVMGGLFDVIQEREETIEVI